MRRYTAFMRSLGPIVLAASLVAGCDEDASWQSSKARAHQAVVEAMCASTPDELAMAIGEVANAATGIPELERRTFFDREAKTVTQSDCVEYRRSAGMSEPAGQAK